MWPWQYIVAIAAGIVGIIVLITLVGRRLAPRLRLALLSEEQRRRLASYQRQAFLGQLANNEARLRAAGEAKRNSAAATWAAKGSSSNGGATLAGMGYSNSIFPIHRTSPRVYISLPHNNLLFIAVVHHPQLFTPTTHHHRGHHRIMGFMVDRGTTWFYTGSPAGDYFRSCQGPGWCKQRHNIPCRTMGQGMSVRCMGGLAYSSRARACSQQGWLC